MAIKKFLLLFVDFTPLKALDELHNTLKKDFNLQSSSMGQSYSSPFKEYEQESRHTAFTPITSKIPNCCKNIWIRTFKVKGVENWGVVLFLAELTEENIVKVSNDPNVREKYEKEVREFLEEKLQFNRYGSLSEYKGIMLNWILFDEVIRLENKDDLVTWLETKESEIHPFCFNRFGWISLLDRNHLIFCDREIELTDSETFPTHYSVISSHEPLIGSTERRMIMHFGPLGDFTTLTLNEFVTLLLARFLPYFHISKIKKNFSIKKETIESISSASKVRFRIVHGRNIMMISYSDQMKQRMDFIKFSEQISKETNFIKKLIRIWKKRLDAGARMSWNELKERGKAPPYEVTLPYPLWWVDDPQIKDTNWGSESPIIHNLTKSIDSALKYNEKSIESVEQSQDMVINYISDALNHLNSRTLVWLTTAIVGLTAILILTSWQELLELFVVISRKFFSFLFNAFFNLSKWF